MEISDLEPIDGGWHVKIRDDGQYCIDILPMLYSFRVVLSVVSPGPHMFIEHGWCYFGHGSTDTGRPRTMEGALLKAVLAAQVWDGHGAPLGFDKQAC